jgi:adenylate cyclase
MIQREKHLLAELASFTPRRIFTRIGINTASVAVGFIGSEHLFNYTALGDGVNLASRLEGANKLYGSQILLSEPTALLIRDAFYLRQLDILRVKGKTQPMPIYELLAEKKAPDAELEDRIRGYQTTFDAYQNQNWDRAEQLLLELSSRFGEDAPLAALLSRVRNYRKHPPPSPWDGVYISTSK